MVVCPKDDNINKKYLLYVLGFLDLSDTITGTAHPQITKTTLELFQIPLPPLDEQRRIAAILDKELTSVEKLKKAAKEQEEAARALAEAYLREMFEFDELPEGWKLERLMDVYVEARKIIDDSSSNLPFLGLEMVESKTGKIDWTAQTMEGSSTCFYFDERHILYGKLRPYLNKVALPEKEGRCSTELIPLIPKDDNCKEYIAYLLRRKETIDYVMAETGSRMPRASMNYLLKLHVAPPAPCRTTPDCYHHRKKTWVCRKTENTFGGTSRNYQLLARRSSSQSF